MFEFFWNVCAFIIAIGVLVTFHEYGHYWVAKRCGVKVLRFSIGFGKPIYQQKMNSGTEFVIARIPLGGYVKMLDERVDDVKEEDKNKTFNSKNVWQRIAIIAAGPFANFLLAFIAFIFVFMLGKTEIKPIVGQVQQGSIIANSSVKPDDVITAINDRVVNTWQDVQLNLINALGSKELIIETKPLAGVSTNKHVVDIQQWSFEPNEISSIESLGIVPFRGQSSCKIKMIQPDSPAFQAGILVGDEIRSVNKQYLDKYCEKFNDIIYQLPNQEITIELERNSHYLMLTAFTGSREKHNELVGYLGIARAFEPLNEKYLVDISYGFFDAIEKSVEKTWHITVLSVNMLGKLVTGDISVKNLSGPVGIAQGAGHSASIGLVYFLSFMAFFSINLGIFNLLPLPVLDGGHLLYYFIELLRGKPVPEHVQEIGFKFGAVLLFGLMAFAILNDISRL